jgi:hypothetical protein
VAGVALATGGGGVAPVESSSVSVTIGGETSSSFSERLLASAGRDAAGAGGGPSPGAIGSAGIALEPTSFSVADG